MVKGFPKHNGIVFVGHPVVAPVHALAFVIQLRVAPRLALLLLLGLLRLFVAKKKSTKSVATNALLGPAFKR